MKKNNINTLINVIYVSYCEYFKLAINMLKKVKMLCIPEQLIAKVITAAFDNCL